METMAWCLNQITLMGFAANDNFQVIRIISSIDDVRIRSFDLMRGRQAGCRCFIPYFMLSTPSDADSDGIGWTDFFAIATVDAVG